MIEYKVNKNWRIIDRGSDLHLLNIVTTKQLIIEEDKEQSLFFIKLFTKPQQLNLSKVILRRKFPKLRFGWFDESVDSLIKHDIIRKVLKKPKNLSDNYLMGLDRQLDYLDQIFPKERKYEMQTRLKNSKVTILGLGTIAQYTILPLIASGVGNFTCVDFDTVDDCNIGRQPIFGVKDIGRPKADVINDYIKESRHDVNVTTHNVMLEGIADIEKYIKGSDLVIHCCDYPRFLIHEWINIACMNLDIPNLVEYSGRIGPLCIPGVTSCYNCLETFLKSDFSSYDSFKSIIREEGFGRYPELAVVASVTGSLAAKEIIAHLLGIPTQTTNAFFDIYPQDLKIIKHKLLKQDECKICKQAEASRNSTTT